MELDTKEYFSIHGIENKADYSMNVITYARLITMKSSQFQASRR